MDLLHPPYLALMPGVIKYQDQEEQGPWDNQVIRWKMTPAAGQHYLTPTTSRLIKYWHETEY